MLAPIVHILPLTTIRRARMLPMPGQVLARQGQRVLPADVIAQVNIPSGHLLLDIRRGLGISKISVAERSIVRQQGDRLEKGDVIAETSGMLARMVRAPAAGEIVSISNAQVLLRTRTSTVEVKAGFSGIVTEVLQDIGAVIETTGALIQGVWGNGKMDGGTLLVLAQSPDEELTREKLDVSMRGGMILAGYCASAEVLRQAADLPVRGLILSSMSTELVTLAEGMPYPIVLIEGFGKIPLNAVAYRLLTTSDKRDISANASYSSATGERPELVIPLPAAADVAPETDEFAVDKVVRIQGAPYSGKTGRILQLSSGFSTLPNGIRARTADVQIDNDTRVTIPLANLEIIE